MHPCHVIFTPLPGWESKVHIFLQDQSSCVQLIHDAVHGANATATTAANATEANADATATAATTAIW